MGDHSMPQTDAGRRLALVILPTGLMCAWLVQRLMPVPLAIEWLGRSLWMGALPLCVLFLWAALGSRSARAMFWWLPALAALVGGPMFVAGLWVAGAVVNPDIPRPADLAEFGQYWVLTGVFGLALGYGYLAIVALLERALHSRSADPGER